MSHSDYPGSWLHMTECTAAFLIPLGVCLLAVRFVLLSEFQVEWVEFFLKGLVEGRMVLSVGEIIETAAFWKILIGAAFGCWCGWIATQKIDHKFRTR